MVPLKYNVRSLFVRKTTTLMTMGSIAFVVLVYIGVLALAAGLRATLADSGDPTTVLVLRDGTRSESESFLPLETHRILASLPAVVRGENGEPLASGETLTLQIFKREDGTEGNVSLRGVEPGAMALRPQIGVVDGRLFVAGKGEVIVGRRLTKRFPDFALGNEVSFGRLRFRVVGVFDDDAGAYSSEIWGAVQDFADAFRRSNYVSSTRLKTSSPEQARALMAQVEADPRLQVKALLESTYYAEQSAASSRTFVILGNFLAVLMAFGACFAAANTMYAQVAARGKEIGTLRALGFRRRTILSAFLIEATVLGLLAGGLGALLALPLNGVTTGTINFMTFSEVTFTLRTPATVLAQGLLLAALTGVVGGVLPAWTASRRPIAGLLREG